MKQQVDSEISALQSALDSGFPEQADARFAAAQQTIEALDPDCSREWAALRVRLLRLWREVRDMPERRTRQARWN